MSPKVLAQTGVSLADIYNVQGSIAGVDQLLSQEVSLVHEMGQNILSERLSSTIRRRSTGDLAASDTFDELITDLPAGITRILQVTVVGDNQGRVNRAAVYVRDPIAGREIPIWVWNDGSDSIRIQDDNGTVGNLDLFLSEVASDGLPSMLFGAGQPQRVPDIAFRGDATAFGAGTVELIVLIQIALMHPPGGGLSSRGLPVPSW